jgi:hypothetical protein
MSRSLQLYGQHHTYQNCPPLLRDSLGMVPARSQPPNGFNIPVMTAGAAAGA